MFSLRKIRDILTKNRLHLSRKMGQNFLVDRNIRDRILDAAEISSGDRVVEIGPGLGALTSGFLERGAKVWAVEKDRGLYRVLTENLDSPNLELRLEDALRLDWEEWLPPPGPYKLVANLPYYITTPLLFRLLDYSGLFNPMVLMVQKEVGERLAAEPGSKAYGALSLKLKYYARVEKLFNVSPHSFFPRPEVFSQVIKVAPRSEPPVNVKNETLLLQLIETGFGQRRKTMFNNLRRAGFVGEQIEKALVHCGLGLQVRAEELDLADFACLAFSLQDWKEGETSG